jgi:hypothetical protein
MGARRVATGLVLVAALLGCGAGGSGVSSASDRDAPAPSLSSASADPTETTAPSVAPEGSIPADLVLPGQPDGASEPPTDQGRLYDYICLDTPRTWTLGTGFVEMRTALFTAEDGRATTIEKLAAYPTAAEAERAVRGLWEQVDECGSGSDHVGQPMSWEADEITGMPAADEALRLTYRSEGTVATVVTVARTGRAVFYVDRRGGFATGVEQDRRTVAEFVPVVAAALG